MFPRAFFAAAFFAPFYFPQSEGDVVDHGPLCGTLSVAPVVNGTLAVEEC